MSREVTAHALVERSLRAFADRPAVIQGTQQLSYAQLSERSARLANALLSAGAGPPRGAAIWLPNTTTFIELDVACMRAGIVRVGIGDRLSADEASYIIEQSDAVALVTDAERLERLPAELVASLALVLVVDFDGPAAGGARLRGYEEALADASPQLGKVSIDATTPSYLLYTSGTTGRPKGATHTQASRARSLINMLASELRQLDRATRYLHAAPLTHGSGSKVLPVIAVGGANVVLDRFSPEAVRAAIDTHDVTHTFLVPTMLQRLLEAGPETCAALRKLRQVTFGGAPISVRLFAAAIDALGPRLTQIYGTSELPHPITVLQPEDQVDDAALMSAGRAAHGVELAVAAVGADTADDAGELLIRAPHAMTGYWRNEQATREVFDEAGWYHSGDLVRVSPEGLVTFVDRSRDLIVSGGLNVYPSEVERALGEHPAVRLSAVVGAPDEEWGEAVVAFVVPTAPGAVSEEQLIAHVRQRLAGYKKPRKVVFVDELPTSAHGKILKRSLRERLWAGRERRVG